MKTDWPRLHQQLQQLRNRLDEDDRRSDADVRQQLAGRARALVRAAPSPQTFPDPARQVLEVTLGGVDYAFGLQYLVEVLPFTPLTPVPNTPAFVLGMLLARGRVVSCIDLMSFLGLPVRQLADPSGILVLAHGDMEVGLPVQKIRGMQAMESAAPPPHQQLPDRLRQLLVGLTAGGAFVLDGERLLADPQLPLLG